VDASRIPISQSVVGDVFRDHGSSTNEGVLADSVVTDDCDIGTNGSTFLDQRWFKSIFAGNATSRINHIGKHARRTAEDIILQRYPFEDRDIVFDLHVVPYFHSLPNEDILPDDTLSAESNPRHDVREVPDLCRITDLAGLFYKACLMGEESFPALLQKDNLPLLLKRSLAARQDLQNLEPLTSICLRLLSSLNTLNEILAFYLQGFIKRNLDNFWFS